RSLPTQSKDGGGAGLGYPHVRVRAGLSSQGERGSMASRSDEDEGSQEGGENERGERPPHAPTLLEILVLIHAGLAGDGAVGLDRAHELERRVHRVAVEIAERGGGEHGGVGRAGALVAVPVVVRIVDRELKR